MNHTFHEIPAEILRQYIVQMSGDNSVLMSAGNIKLYNSSVASCRYASDLTFKPLAVCFLRPQQHVIRFIEKNDYFTLSYFPQEYQYILDFFGSKSSASISTVSHKLEPLSTQIGNVFYPQAQYILECRKVFSLELILSREIQDIMTNEKKRAIYPGKEVPRMFVGEITHGWFSLEQKALPEKRSGQ